MQYDITLYQPTEKKIWVADVYAVTGPTQPGSCGEPVAVEPADRRMRIHCGVPQISQRLALIDAADFLDAHEA